MIYFWKELRSNFSEICWRVLDRGAFYLICNRQLGKSVVVEQDSWTYGVLQF